MKAACCIAAFAAGLAASAATIDRVVVRQQWPWSTSVKVEYRIVGISSPVDVSVAVFDGDAPLESPTLAAALSGDVYGVSENGDHALFIDPVAAFGASRAAIPEPIRQKSVSGLWSHSVPR